MVDIDKTTKMIRPIFRGFNVEDQEDMIQDTLIKVWQKQVEDKALIYKIARDVRVDYLRRISRQPTMLSFDAPVRSTNDDPLTLQETIADTRNGSIMSDLVDLPARVKTIAENIVAGVKLSNSDKQFLYRYRQQVTR